MKIHEFGEKTNPVLLLLPGTMCYWKGNFGGVMDALAQDFLVAVVAYTGFDETDKESYVSVVDEVERIEDYVNTHYQGRIRAAYGCSLGGTFVAHLTARRNIHMEYGIIGSSDLDQLGRFKAAIMTELMVKVTYNFIHTGSYKSKLLQKRFEQKMASPDPYNKAFVAITGRDKYDMSFITKESLKNQFKSDVITPLPKQIDNGETEIHVFYAKKMGEKYLERYRTYFKNPVIHEQDLRHEELLGVYPKEWCDLVKKICLKITNELFHEFGGEEKMIQIGNEKTDYGNWVPAAMMKLCYIVSVILGLIELVCIIFKVNGIVLIVLGILFSVVLAFTLYMQKCRNIFDFKKGGFMGKMHQNLIDQMKWDGNGRLLDIGCGAGALTIRCAKKYKDATLVGIDYWGAEWSYAKEQCEKNADAEGVGERITFQKGDAGKLEFEDGCFDAAVSNFVFHEVRTQPDKRQVVREALRVVKKGGFFAFQDMFEQKALYGDMNEFVELLKKEGITEVHYIGNVDKTDLVPKFVTAPWMIKGVGIIYGIK